MFLCIGDEAAVQDIAGAFSLREQGGDRACRAGFNGYDSELGGFDRIKSELSICLQLSVCNGEWVCYLRLLSGVEAFGRGCLVFFPSSQMRLQLCEAHRVEHTVLWHRAFAGHQNAPLKVVDFVGQVGIRIYAEQAPELEPARTPAPVKVETPRIGVDLSGDAVLGTGRKSQRQTYAEQGEPAAIQQTALSAAQSC